VFTKRPGTAGCVAHEAGRAAVRWQRGTQRGGPGLPGSDVTPPATVGSGVQPSFDAAPRLI
jgi:hypothetical protein